MGIIDKAVANSVSVIPRLIVRKIAGRYIAGESLDDAIGVIRNLNEESCVATVDVLGESTESERDAVGKLEQYKRVIDALDQHDLKSGISVKLTGLGLDLDEELCRRDFEEIVVYAGERGRFVRVDMEDSPYTGVTLDGHHPRTGSRDARAPREHRGRHPGLHEAQPQGRNTPGRSWGLGASLQGHL